MAVAPPQHPPSFGLLSALLALVFGGAIVGETVALSMVVGTGGTNMLGGLYLVNGFLLFLLPVVFYPNVDRVNRGRLMTYLLLGTSAVLVVYFVVVQGTGLIGQVGGRPSWLVPLLYLISYLSKTFLFLTFWTLANDVYYTGEAKKAFPFIASWGFIGALLGALLSRVLLFVADPEMVILVWAGAYFAAFILSARITKRCRTRLLHKEAMPEKTSRGGGLVAATKAVLSVDLLRLMSVLYFFVFVGVFSLDYLFWHKCNLWFLSTHGLASFQFTFYLAHGVVTILGLRLVMPGLIARWGFPRLFFVLPVVLLVGALVMVGFEGMGFGMRTAFVAYVVLQFARYVAFENAFSPLYQMFFAAIPRERRGRAKTFLEGTVKPAAIIVAGVLLILFRDHPILILVIIWALAGGMIWVVGMVRTAYMRKLVPDFTAGNITDEIIAQIGTQYDQKIVSLIREYSRSPDAGLRILAVKILAHLGSRQAFTIISEMYDREEDDGVRELIARSLTHFYWYETKEFIEKLLKSPNPKICSGALYSLNNMNSHWKWRLKDVVKGKLFGDNVEEQVEAAQYLWYTHDRGERETVQAYVNSLLASEDCEKKSAGLLLVAVLKPRDWENVVLRNLRPSSFQVFSKGLEAVLRSGSLEAQLKALLIVETLSREHIACAGRAVANLGLSMAPTVVAYLRSARKRRMIFEMVHALRVVLDQADPGTKEQLLGSEIEEMLTAWISRELEVVYRDCFVWYHFLERHPKHVGRSCVQMLDDALREQQHRLCEWALDTLALLEKRNVVSQGRRDLDLSEHAQRLDLIEIVQGYGNSELNELVVPILEFESWAVIAQLGKEHFLFDEEVRKAGMGQFILSENKWICLCALYCAADIPECRGALSRTRPHIELLMDDPYIYLSRVARVMSQRETGSRTMATDTFNLLETVLFFKRTMLFRNVPAEKLMGLAEISQHVSYYKDTIVSREGDVSNHLYVVKSGSLKIVKVKNNVRTVVSIVRTGDAYGEIGLINQAPRSATAIANEDCEAYVVQRNSLKKLLMDMPEIAYNFLEIFSEKLRRSGEEVALLNTTLSSRIRKDMPGGNSGKKKAE